VDLSVTVNGRAMSLPVEPRQLLGQVLRDQVGDDLRLDCETSTCGSCTVLFDGDAVKSCALLAPMAAGAEIVTREGLPRSGVHGRVLDALDDSSVLPCGECTAAVEVVVAALLKSNPMPTQDDVARALSGTVCRCTGYQSVVDAVLDAVGFAGAPREAARS
jgi:carbon-monoxide dehydrogenase small subunit